MPVRAIISCFIQVCGAPIRWNAVWLQAYNTWLHGKPRFAYQLTYAAAVDGVNRVAAHTLPERAELLVEYRPAMSAIIARNQAIHARVVVRHWSLVHASRVSERQPLQAK